eukprot:Phypoly_transcript_08082.p1 GENE.Phypoly_transcript_08082~~Phypoly_transcript_08082.p1  ORF type:complete len:519 (+),score=61.78 Phypoly_transcript_08082:163-1557(+)
MSTYQLGRHYQVLLGKFAVELRVNKWPIVDYSQFFQCLTEECPYLEHLHIRSVPFQPASVHALRKLLQTVSLKSFSFTETTGVTSECFECILQNAPALTSLTVTGVQLSDENLQYLPNHPSLTQLRLENCCRLGAAGLEYLKACAGLRHLTLIMNQKWANEEMSSFCSLESGCTQLESLDLNRIKKFKNIRIHLPNLTTLKIDTSLTEIEAFELGCHELKKLSLKLELTNGEMIAKEIPNLKKLVSFKLREDQFNNVDFSEIVRHVGKHSDMKTLKLPCMNGYIAPQVLSTLTSPLENILFLNIAEISDETIEAFTKHLPNLRKLDVSGSSLVHPIFNFPNLEVLDSNKIATLQSIRIKCPNLSILDISNCQNLESAEWDCPDLVTIYMAGLDKFTNEEFCKMTSSCQNLTKVMMSKLLNINDDVAVALCTLPKLQILNLADCPQVTPKTMEQLYTIFPNILFT